MLYFLSSGTYGPQVSTFLPGRSALLWMSLASRCMVILDAVVAAGLESGVVMMGGGQVQGQECVQLNL